MREKTMSNLPMQPVHLDLEQPRFVPNKLVKYLLEHGGIDMNKLATLDFPKEDRQQFAQLIGYSVEGYGTLSYADAAVYETASRRAEQLRKYKTVKKGKRNA